MRRNRILEPTPSNHIHRIEEKKLFQFPNGVDEIYGPLLLMMPTLPTVKVAQSSVLNDQQQQTLKSSADD